MIKDPFAYSTQNKLRFASPRGDLTAEDLFDLPLTSARGISLDSISTTVLEEKAATPRKSLVVKETTTNIDADVKIAIIEYIVAYKQELASAKEGLKAKQARILKVEEALLAKDEKALTKASKKELEAELAELRS